ncbi:MAG: hypothetical protein CMG60_03055 [Candidatus Marinimicrobia bacterium]|nr:hypothetical protein [Candidatus Neomarinimicrobiota bacterium]|tara:strand:+ start:926 stop:2020 length:1095 start_codon:yes stop_codon:yes gene_type:complete
MLNRLDQYLIRQFLTILSISLLGFLSIFLIVDLIENLDRFMDNNVPVAITLKYYLYTIPYFLSIGLPMAVLISTVFSLGNIVKHNEWTVLKASGISIYRITIPYVLCGVILSGISFMLDNMLVAYGNEKRFEIDREFVKRKSRHKLKNILKNIFIQKNVSTHISLSKYYIRKKTGNNLTMIDLGERKLRKRIDAKKIIWNQDSSKWALQNYSIRYFSQAGSETEVILGKKDTLMNLGFIPGEIQQNYRKPEELDYFMLTKQIKKLKTNGVDTKRWEVTRLIKISFAFTNLIVILCGIPLVLIKEKNNLSFGMGASIFVIFGYYALIKFGQSLGFKGILEPLVAAWMGNFIFFMASIILFWRCRT